MELPPDAERQRMCLGKRALAFETGRDGRFEQLRELAQLLPGLGVVDALASVDDRPLGGEQGLGDVSNRRADPGADRVRGTGR